ncbi:MAG: LysM peptidoglycan-binding domain-containing protein [Brumimicrobium sp.]
MIRSQNILFLLLFAFIGIEGFAQDRISKDTLGDDVYSFDRILETSLEDYYLEYASSQAEIDSIIRSFGHDYDDVPEFPDSIYCQRLEELNKMTPFKLDCNDITLSTIKFFTKKRRNFTSIVLGRSELYFNMFEEKLAKHGLPIELKYLAVIESGLRPSAKSRAGALGLWQFMYRTGKFYNLNQNSYIDERMDPELATEAAALYLKKLHSLYDDWNMALAAYNAGPGNVNKAIRRSGGKMTYWGIRPFLPRETQGYVPNFVAMSYMLNYHAEHNIKSREPFYHDFEIDTVCISKPLHMSTIDSIIGWNKEDIQALNPIYKTDFIPYTEKHKCINIPSKYIEDWIVFEDSIYVLDSVIYNSEVQQELLAKESQSNSRNATVHRVTKGQTLGHIARLYGTTVSNIMQWNNMSSTRLAIGQRLNIYSKSLTKETQTSSNITKQSNGVKTYTVTSGDSLWAIAQRNSTTVEDLKKLNPDVDHRDLKVGQKIRVQ